jgi:hypothetical protein
MTVPGPDLTAAIGDQFPGCNAWVSATGRWWAIRKAILTASQVADGSLPLLHAEDEAGLTRRIREQEACRAQSPAERFARSRDRR